MVTIDLVLVNIYVFSVVDVVKEVILVVRVDVKISVVCRVAEVVV